MYLISFYTDRFNVDNKLWTYKLYIEYLFALYPSDNTNFSFPESSTIDGRMFLVIVPFELDRRRIVW